MADDSSLPTLSIITVVLNAAESIEATMHSVLEQDYPNLEYIVIDGGSTDGTTAIIERFKHQLAWYSSEPDSGIYDAMNKGLAHATGDYIGFKNAGDTYYSGALAAIMTEAKHFSTPAVIYGDTHKLWPQPGTHVLRKTLLRSNHLRLQTRSCVDHRSAFVLRRLHRPFDLQYKIAADYDLFCELLSHGHKFIGTDVIVGTMQGGGVSDTATVYAEVEAIQARYFGKAYAWANNARLRMSFWRLQMQNKVLKSVLGEQGYTRFKTRGQRKG